jgi:hypothetical protein
MSDDGKQIMEVGIGNAEVGAIKQRAKGIGHRV